MNSENFQKAVSLDIRTAFKKMHLSQRSEKIRNYGNAGMMSEL